jgi:non-ribosomal peptide synthase protein (TIGR01720 family)
VTSDSRSRVTDRLGRLTPEQRAAVQRRLAQRRPPESPLLRRSGDAALSPLGLDQERLWILDQLEPGSNTYNISVGLRFRGALDDSVFSAAVAAVVRRHEILRSGIELRDGRPWLRVHDVAAPDVRYMDLRAAPERLDATMRELVRIPFDLSVAGLMRIAVLRIADDEYQVVETMHHSITDQWSYVRFNREILEHYRAFQENRPPAVPDLPVQFGDFAQWQRDVFAGEARERHRTFWSGYLQGAPARLMLPYDILPGPEAGYWGARHYFRLGDEISGRFLAMCRSWRVTVSDGLLAVYAALLHEETGEHDIVIGLPSATRSRPETHDLIGFLLTNVPLRAQLPPDPAPAHVLESIRLASAAVADHREVPFSEIVKAASPERGIDRHPLIQTMHLVLDFDDTVFRVPGAEVYATEVEDGVSPMDLTLGWWRAGSTLYGRFEYRTALFRQATVDRLARRLMSLVADFVDYPDEPLRPRPGRRRHAAPRAVLPAPEDDSGQQPDQLLQIEAAWREILGRDVAPDDDFFHAGGTSLQVVELAHALRAAGFPASPRDVYRFPTMRGQLSLLRRGEPEQAVVPMDGRAVSPEQEELLEAGLERVEGWSHSLILVASSRLDPEWLRVTARRLVRAHPGLCSLFRRSADGGWQADQGDDWRWRVESPGADPAAVAAGHREFFDAVAGPLFAISLIPGEPDRVVLTAHHLVVDGISWQILVNDLDRAYRGEPPVAEPLHPARYASARRAQDFTGQLRYWREQRTPVAPLTCRRPGANALGGEATCEERVAMPGPVVSWLGESLTAVARAVSPWTGGHDVVVDFVGAGREHLLGTTWDPGRAVGYYATTFPVRLPSAADPVRNLELVIEALDGVPDGGKGYLALRYAADPSTRRDLAGDRPELSFNYLGTLLGDRPGPERLFTVARQIGPTGNERSARSHVVNVLFAVDGDDAIFTWQYNPDAIDENEVRSAARRAAAEFARLSQVRGNAGTPGVSGMSLREVNDMFATLSSDRNGSAS